MTPKPIEPMPLDEVRERFRYTATSHVSTWEPADVARMRLTVEALVAVYEEARNVATLPRNEWPTLLKLVDAVVATKPRVVWVRCLATDEIPHAGVVGGMYARRCSLRAAHAGPCVFGEP